VRSMERAVRLCTEIQAKEYHEPHDYRPARPKHAQEIYKEAFNSAEEQYGEESRAHRVAWSVVERKYEKTTEATG
jgi:cation transport regulator